MFLKDNGDYMKKKLLIMILGFIFTFSFSMNVYAACEDQTTVGDCGRAGRSCSWSSKYNVCVTGPASEYEAQRESGNSSSNTSVPSRKNLEYVACGESGGIPAPVPQLTSALYTILIIATPISLVIFSIVALVKALTSGSQDDIKKAQSKVIKKFIAAALVFFIAGMVQFVITKAADASEKTSIVSCIDCLLYHENCTPSDSENDVIIQEPNSNDDKFELPSK